MKKALVSVCTLLTLGLFSCGKAPVSHLPVISDDTPPPSKSPVVRVLILDTKERISVEVGSANVACRQNDGTITDGYYLNGAMTVSRSGDRLRVSKRGGGFPETPILIIRTEDPGGFKINGKRYRGTLMLQRGNGDRILAINIVAIDDYLKGVLPSEIGYLKKEQHEAFLVQAIASRSYALSKLDEKKGELYDLRSTIMDQVYKGVDGEYPGASRAVEESRGIVALWNGNPIKAYYSSCCGGYTADIRVGWPWKADFPYLYGGRDAEAAKAVSFCSDSRHFRWEHHWKGGDLLKILKKSLPAELGSRVASFSRLIDIGITGTSRSGRVKGIVITTDNGEYEIVGDRIRWVLRPDSAGGPILRSTLFKMKLERKGGRVVSVDLKGGGNGHGTGMCQTGAIRMAELGYSAFEILLHYYPGVKIEKIYE